MAGSLFVVSTPIGNLGDITERAKNVLAEADFIICEDTRVTGILLKNFEIKNELVSFNARTEEKKIQYVKNRILNGENCAIVSDAGTPGISDPGTRMVSAAIENDIEVVAVPGANAAIAALSISGLPTDSFLFEGFLPQKKGRKKKLTQLAEENRTIIFYESVYRIEKLIKELSEYMPERFVVVSREITKKFEENWRGFPNELLEDFPNRIIKGEFVVVIAPIGWKVNS